MNLHPNLHGGFGAGRKIWESNFSVTLSHTPLRHHLTDSKKETLLQQVPHAEVLKQYDKEAIRATHLTAALDSTSMMSILRQTKSCCKEINGSDRHIRKNFAFCNEPEGIVASGRRSIPDEVACGPFARGCSFVPKFAEKHPEAKGHESQSRCEVAPPSGAHGSKAGAQKQAENAAPRKGPLHPEREENIFISESVQPAVAKQHADLVFRNTPSPWKAREEEMSQPPLVARIFPAGFGPSGRKKPLRASQIPPGRRRTTPRCEQNDVHKALFTDLVPNRSQFHVHGERFQK
eukprot:gnl/MRDRNA2_/MRDRNA2_113745_c0_seq1.p1 gnl/MRDRNA2_/MRDRNA2_113745_c0~~gnl/MRDRNA2_/MRDRNA2_113745_c0_seq1.p1  ORF type:complete len:291 (-),score=54.20 gnl/MRDRNA2_/MRDRNA2_113745_c0_seq1:455-1327(-)